MEYFKSITQSDLIGLINSTREELFLCLPSLHQEVASALKKAAEFNQEQHKKAINIHILIDFDPQTFRQGYGEFSAIDELKYQGFDVKNLKDNRVSFIISDKTGYYLFIESRSIIPADKITINAIRIDPVSIVRIKQYFFNGIVKNLFEDELANAIIEEGLLLQDPSNFVLPKSSLVSNISAEDYETVKQDLEKNPPIHPDYKRVVDFYSNKLQYGELHFEGQNFQYSTIQIPSNLLPYKNKEIRDKLITKLKLFEKIKEHKDYKAFDDLDKKKKEISAKYLTPIKCRRNKSILKKTEKIQFEAEVKKLETQLADIKHKLYNLMSDEIDTARIELRRTFYLFLLENPTEEMEKMGEDNYPRMALVYAHN
jgi:hypothetical protein